MILLDFPKLYFERCEGLPRILRDEQSAGVIPFLARTLPVFLKSEDKTAVRMCVIMYFWEVGHEGAHILHIQQEIIRLLLGFLLILNCLDPPFSGGQHPRSTSTSDIAHTGSGGVG